MHATLESPDQPDVIALIAELDAYQDTLYPPESRHALDLASLKQASVLFVVARDEAAQAIGCGAVVLGAEGGELKRMYVHPRGRGQGALWQHTPRGCLSLWLYTLHGHKYHFFFLSKKPQFVAVGII